MALPWVASVLKWLGHAQYNSTPPVLAEGEVAPLQHDGSGNLKVAVVSGGGALSFANIGVAQRLYWDISAASAAVIQGYAGTFAAPTGAESFDISIGGGAAITVTPLVTDTSAALIAATINGTPGLSGVAAAVYGGVRLTHTTSIAVTNMGPSLFAKTGIPNMSRDRAQTNIMAIQMPVEIGPSERELVSKPITVPAGANRMSLTVTLTNAASDAMGGEFVLAWGNGLVGESIATMADAPIQAGISGTIANRATDVPFGSQQAFAGAIQLVGSVPSGSFTRMFELTVPPGATKLYVIPLTARSQSDASTPPRPRNPPLFSATVAFASR